MTQNVEPITVLDKPLKVDIMEWVFQHPDCDTIYEKSGDGQKIYVFAYSNSKEGNQVLLKYRDEKMKEKRLMAGMEYDAVSLFN